MKKTDKLIAIHRSKSVSIEKYYETTTTTKTRPVNWLFVTFALFFLTYKTTAQMRRKVEEKAKRRVLFCCFFTKRDTVTKSCTSRNGEGSVPYTGGGRSVKTEDESRWEIKLDDVKEDHERTSKLLLGVSWI